MSEDHPEVDKVAAIADNIQSARSLRKAVEDGDVAPRDAALYAGLAGLKAIKEKGTEASRRFGIGARQASKIASMVQNALSRHDLRKVDPTPTGDPEGPSSTVEALVAGELDLAEDDHRSDALAALATRRALIQGTPVTRKQSHEPVPAANRVRRHRLRRSIDRRASMLGHSPDLSYGQPYLIVPWRLPDDLIDWVPPQQRHRSKAPDEDYLATVTDELDASYARRDGRADQLARIALWGFSRHPSSPNRALEARALRTCLIIARERGRISSYWLHRRLQHIIGEQHPETLFTVADAAITLRDHGYWDAANSLLFERLRDTQRAGFDPALIVTAQCRLLSQLVWNHCHSQGGRPTQSFASLDVARRLVDSLQRRAEVPGGEGYGSVAKRRLFDIELSMARLRAQERRERLWLGREAESALDAAEAASNGPGEYVLYRIQWSLTRMLVGTLRRDADEIIESASRFHDLAAAEPWTMRDSPDEYLGYRIYRKRAVARFPKLDALLPYDFG